MIKGRIPIIFLIVAMNDNLANNIIITLIIKNNNKIKEFGTKNMIVA